MMKVIAISTVGGVALALSQAAQASVAPYAADASTLALYHFDEAPGAADPGTPIANYGTNGVALANTGGPDGRDNVGAGGYGATAFGGFGSSFDLLNSGNGLYQSTANSAGGGVRTTGAVTQANLQGADGAFTYEALISISTLTGEQTIISHDGPTSGTGTTSRGFMLRIDSTGNLSFYNGVSSITAAIPSSGTHAFAANQWFHVAATYDGNGGAAGNLKLYWTRLDSGVTEANLVGSGSLASDFGNGSDGNWFGVGTTTRGEFRFQPKGYLDEVRISSVARGAGDFVFAVPEPTSLAVLGAAGVILAARRRIA